VITSFLLPSKDRLQAIYLVPKNAIFIIETDEPIDTWNTISKSDVWKHLQTNSYFKELTSSINNIDKIFNQKKNIIDLIGNRDLYISVHMISKKKFSIFFTIDLQKMSKLNLIKNNLETVVAKKSFSVTKRQYHGFTINEIKDNKTHETLYLAFIKNQMIASYTHKLIEASIDQHLEPKIGRDLDFIAVSKKVSGSDLFRLYVQYKYLDDYSYYFVNNPNNSIKELSNTLKYSGFSFDLKRDNTIYATGFTNTNERTQSYIKALHNSGVGAHNASIIAPERTAIYLSFGFNSFKEFYNNFIKIQKENTNSFKTYQDNLDRIQNYLDIDLHKNFISWMDNEIAILHIESPSKTKQNTETALIIKTNSISNAKKQIAFVLKQIKKKTPVKFKQIIYKDHDINFLSIKGFFKLFLGSYFKEFDKPYFTFIDDYIVFSNHPNTLKQIIDDFKSNKTLNKASDYKKFIRNFKNKSSVFAYINTPTLYNNLLEVVDNKTKEKIKKNKNYIICFPQIGFQLIPYSELFETKLVVNYQDPEIVASKSQFKETTVKDFDITNYNPKQNKEIVLINQKELFKPQKISLNNLDTNEYTKKYSNNKKQVFVKIKNGKPNGRYKEYYPNGELKLTGRFKNGKQVGVWKLYNANGKLIKKKRF
jgi:antitoxin component YwqK of YwqJK toxin-antitoxin module